MLIGELIFLALFGLWRAVLRPRENRAGALALVAGLAIGGMSLLLVPDAWIESWWIYLLLLAVLPFLAGFVTDGISRLRRAHRVGEFASGPFLHGFAFVVSFLIVRLAA